MHLPHISLEKMGGFVCLFLNKQTTHPKPLSQKISVKAEVSMWKKKQRIFLFFPEVFLEEALIETILSVYWHLKGNLQIVFPISN